MKYLIPMFALMSLLAGCSTNRGGANVGYEAAPRSEAYPVPTAGPTARPGMTPEDPRDSQYVTRPEPLVPPPTTKP